MNYRSQREGQVYTGGHIHLSPAVCIVLVLYVDQLCLTIEQYNSGLMSKADLQMQLLLLLYINIALIVVLTGIRQVQVCSAGGQHSGIDAGNNVGLVHDEVHNIVICCQFAL